MPRLEYTAKMATEIGDRNPKPEAKRIFKIQAVLAVSPDHPRWSGVYAHSFRDERTDKLMIHSPQNEDLVRHPSRCSHDGWEWTELAPALEMAERIRRYGRWASAWEHNRNQESAQKERLIRPTVRVVEIQSVKTVTVHETFWPGRKRIKKAA